MRIAIVHDYLAQFGGAERVVAAMHDIWPEAPVFTSVYDAKAMGPRFEKMQIVSSPLQRWAGKSKIHKAALPFYPGAFESFDFRDFDLVISSSSGFAKGIITSPDALHISYCHTPMRLAWRFHEYVTDAGFGPLARAYARLCVSRMRSWDCNAATRVDDYVANSFNTARRISKFYRRGSAVIYPPVECDRFEISRHPSRDFYLVVSRLVGYKRIDLAIETMSRMRLPLKVVGAGSDLARLRASAGDSIEFLGALPDREVAELMANCKALLLPGEEDFGITPLEAMASGTSVIAFGAGGALETVVDGKTGILFAQQDVHSMASALIRHQAAEFEPETLRRHALQFDVPVFRERMQGYVENKFLTAGLPALGPDKPVSERTGVAVAEPS